MNPVNLFAAIIKEHSPEDVWQDSPLAEYRMLGNTNRGEIGEEFVRRYLRTFNFDVGNGNRTSRTDLQVNGRAFEVKTASLGAKGTFQFNHVRLDREYEYLLCLGICPNELRFNIWRKGEVAEGKAGKLVRMAEGQAVTYKISKKLDDLLNIDCLPATLRTLWSIA
ncbi:MAG: hypothetical protein F4234_05595 [Gammaproteobacteria bacterium]|nr:hypothetical protein [Gammaproteobacteria bacterium]MXY90174.1 hypothetical protein [Gammaproteobacteria bacterium]MYA36079.1 hypothetical protein [Gammaproteobacteria bacterium]MYC58851.1 hypothetical protein [Gammaproteobacteria bacterium]MYE29136.1 hypothetical protein [Gammaproteobacteria bacterium]